MKKGGKKEIKGRSVTEKKEHDKDYLIEKRCNKRRDTCR